MSDEQKSFFDGRTLLAIALMIAVWMGWESYLKRKYPQPLKTPTEVAQVNETQTQPVKTAPTDSKSSPTAATLSAAPATEASFSFVSPEINFDLSSAGMGIKNVVLNKYVDRKNSPVTIGANREVLSLQTNLKGQTEPIPFRVEKVSDTEFKGTATVGGVSVTKTMKVDSAKYLITTTTEVVGSTAGVAEYLSEESHPTGATEGKTLGDDPNTWLSFFAHAEGKGHFEHPPTKESFAKETQQVNVASLGSRYFAIAAADDSKVIPNLRMVSDPARNLMYGALEYQMLDGKSLTVSNKFFVGPKSVELLRAADTRLENIVDFGMFSWIAYPILDLLKWLYKMMHNYGYAIIVLTILVRMIVLPFNIMSYRSMKAMQAIQPQITRLKERHKDDREALNREMMILMRDNKVNPLGGCLPMLLQLPVFLALYQVLNATIELYHSPWILWIHDLSLKDPYYVLPVLMGIVMFIQQKITPTTMDPAQAKVMQFMPIMFTFLMISLPSGLTLYIFVSTLFGIIQQLVFMRDKKAAAEVVAA